MECQRRICKNFPRSWHRLRKIEEMATEAEQGEQVEEMEEGDQSDVDDSQPCTSTTTCRKSLFPAFRAPPSKEPTLNELIEIECEEGRGAGARRTKEFEDGRDVYEERDAWFAVGERRDHGCDLGDSFNHDGDTTEEVKYGPEDFTVDGMAERGCLYRVPLRATIVDLNGEMARINRE